MTRQKYNDIVFEGCCNFVYKHNTLFLSMQTLFHLVLSFLRLSFSSFNISCPITDISVVDTKLVESDIEVSSFISRVALFGKVEVQLDAMGRGNHSWYSSPYAWDAERSLAF